MPLITKTKAIPPHIHLSLACALVHVLKKKYFNSKLCFYCSC